MCLSLRFVNGFALRVQFFDFSIISILFILYFRLQAFPIACLHYTHVYPWLFTIFEKRIVLLSRIDAALVFDIEIVFYLNVSYLRFTAVVLRDKQAKKKNFCLQNCSLH